MFFTPPTNNTTGNGWDRYQDTHIGLELADASTSSCDSYVNYTRDSIESAGYTYSLREAHFYTATPGVRTWEFNLNNCDYEYGVELCGCVATNNQEDYAALVGDDYLQTVDFPCGYA